jgi:hypothetical protein
LLKIFRKLENAEEKCSAQNQPTTNGSVASGSPYTQIAEK